MGDGGDGTGSVIGQGMCEGVCPFVGGGLTISWQGLCHSGVTHRSLVSPGV
jgi:hypothetical protein